MAGAGDQSVSGQGYPGNGFVGGQRPGCEEGSGLALRGLLLSWRGCAGWRQALRSEMPVPTVDQYGGNFVCRVRRRAGRTEALAEHVKADWQGPGLPNATCFTVVLMRHLHRPAGLAALAVLIHLAEDHLSAGSLQDAGD